MKEKIATSAIMLFAGSYSIVRAFRGKEFYLSGIGGNKASRPLPNWIGRSLMFLLGIAAIALGVGLWQK